VGRELEPDAFDKTEAKWLIRAAKAVAEETERAPRSSAIVLQRVRRWVNEGKLKSQVAKDAFFFLESVDECAQIPEWEDVMQELVPVLRRRAEQRAVTNAVDAYGSRSDLTKAAEQLRKATRIGEIPEDGIRMGMEAIEDARKLLGADRMPTGIFDLDVAVGGGLSRACLGVAISSTGGGKSMFLSQTFATALVHGKFVLYATLELAESLVVARAMAAVTGVTIDNVLNGDPRVSKRLESGKNKLGIGLVREFPAGSTTAEDLADWAEACSEKEGRMPDLMVVDYADKLSSKSSSSLYESAGKTYDALRNWAMKNNTWVWTASQATRGSGGKQRIDLEDTADSMHKVRVADLVVSLTPQEGVAGREIEILVAKNRSGDSRMSVGPLPATFAFGRLTTPAPGCTLEG
jgi:KaiC/GvpD/RAD55 family RecA-like ATPase